ncbi:MAG TPA: ribosomal protein S18-alanine N-acetyltransferase [Chitinivibrionales bacterium]|nr:ribosomal protein S18-alanine N-acetyltransferase [Chitinivibrionales bacterium]
MERCPVFIRPAAGNDLAAILDIEKYCCTVTWNLSSFRSELSGENRINLVAQAYDGPLCGFIFSMLAADELEINTLAVGPTYQRLGIAQKLLAAAAQAGFSRGAETMHLEVRSRNRPAVCLYEKLGFEVRWIRKKYYSDNGDDAIVMSKSIEVL